MRDDSKPPSLLNFPGWHSGQFWSIVLYFISNLAFFNFKYKCHIYSGLHSLDCFLELSIKTQRQLVNFWFLHWGMQNTKQPFGILAAGQVEPWCRTVLASLGDTLLPLGWPHGLTFISVCLLCVIIRQDIILVCHMFISVTSGFMFSEKMDVLR